MKSEIFEFIVIVIFFTSLSLLIIAPLILIWSESIDLDIILIKLIKSSVLMIVGIIVGIILRKLIN